MKMMALQRAGLLLVAHLYVRCVPLLQPLLLAILDAACVHGAAGKLVRGEQHVSRGAGYRLLADALLLKLERSLPAIMMMRMIAEDA